LGYLRIGLEMDDVGITLAYSMFEIAGEHRNSEKSDWLMVSPPQITCRLKAKKNSTENIGMNNADNAKNTQIFSELYDDPGIDSDSFRLDFLL